MSGIYKGSQEIKHVFKGGQKLSAIFKGGVMVYPTGVNGAFAVAQQCFVNSSSDHPNLGIVQYTSLTGVNLFAPLYNAGNTATTAGRGYTLGANMDDNGCRYFWLPTGATGTITIKCSAQIYCESSDAFIWTIASETPSPYESWVVKSTRIATEPNVWTTAYWETTFAKNRGDYQWRLYPCVIGWTGSNTTMKGIRSLSLWID